MRLGNAGVEDGDHLARAGEPQRGRLIRLDQRHALQEVGRHRHVLLDAGDTRGCKQQSQGCRVGIERKERNGVEEGHTADTALRLIRPAGLPFVRRRSADVRQHRVLGRAQAGALALDLRRSQRLLVGQVLGQTDDQPHLTLPGGTFDERRRRIRTLLAGNDEQW